jgi:quercetin dioxygenase-like cupin family protein
VRTNVLAGAAATGGSYALLEVAAARGVVHSPHVHRCEDEALMVVSGSVTAVLDRDEHRLDAGDLLLLPRGVPHSVAVTSDSATFLIACMPAGLEDLLAGSDGGWSRDDDDLAALLATRGVEWVPGPSR